MSFNNLLKFSIPYFAIILIVPSLFIPTTLTDYNTGLIFPDIDNFNISNSLFCWPIPGYTKISSYFGNRKSPTAGASSFHQGIDIPAPNGTNLVATLGGFITFTGFNGSAGYSIHISSNNLQFLYHHVSPEYIVKIGDYVHTGQIIGQVGPKNVYGIKNNPYKDNAGKPTNGASTGPHLHFSIKKDGKAVNPLNYFL